MNTAADICSHGSALLAAGESAEAASEFRAAISLEPASALAHYHLGRTLRSLGRLTEARESFDRATTINSSMIEAQLNRIQIRHLAGEYIAAENLLKQMLEMADNSPSFFAPLVQTVEHLEWEGGWSILLRHFTPRKTHRRRGWLWKKSVAVARSFIRSKVGPETAFSYVIVIPVWGERHTHTFLNYGLPSLLAPGNLPALRQRHPRFRFGTTTSDWEIIRSHSAFKQLAELMPVEVDLFENKPVFSSYDRMTLLHNRALAAYSGQEVALIFINSDTVFGSTSMLRADQAMTKGARAVMCLGLRTDQEIALTRLDRLRVPKKEFTVSNRELAHIALRSLHPMSKGHFWTSDGSEEDAHYYQLSRSDCLLAKCFHLHPIMLRQNTRRTRFVDTTIDHDLVRALVEDISDVYVACDSDDVFAIELSPTEYRTSIRRPPSIDRSLNWASEWTSLFHRKYAESCIKVHSDDLTDADYLAVSSFDSEFESAYLSRLRSILSDEVDQGMRYKLRS